MDKEIVFFLKNTLNIEIHIFSFDPILGNYNLSSCDKTFYNNWDKSLFNKIKGVRTIIHPFYNSLSLLLFLSRNKNMYDVIHFKWLRSIIVLSYLFIQKYSLKTIATFWGGEFESQKILYSKGLYRVFLKKFLNKVDVITYGTTEGFVELTNFGLGEKKLKKTIYGSDILKEIQNLLSVSSKKKCKSNLGIESNKTTITIGYSGKQIHQHLKVINALIHNNHFMKIKNSFVFIIPFTYGGNELYMSQIKDELTKNDLNYLIINTKCNEKEIAEIRIASDIMVQATLFDGRSSSIIEFLLAGSIMISGDWLPYKLFKEKLIHFYEVEKFDRINFPKLVISVHKNIHMELEKSANNSQKWGFNETWERTIDKWISLY